jgi:hypothetical protein
MKTFYAEAMGRIFKIKTATDCAASDMGMAIRSIWGNGVKPLNTKTRPHGAAFVPVPGCIDGMGKPWAWMAEA